MAFATVQIDIAEESPERQRATTECRE